VVGPSQLCSPPHPTTPHTSTDSQLGQADLIGTGEYSLIKSIGGGEGGKIILPNVARKGKKKKKKKSFYPIELIFASKHYPWVFLKFPL